MKRILLLFFLLMAVFETSHAQKEKFQSLFIYNFTKYIKWPETYNEGNFVIGVYGNSNIINSLNSMVASKKKTGSGSIIVVKKYDSIEEIDDCNILFISENTISNLIEIDVGTSSKPILIITDTPGMAKKGSVINFVEKDGRIRFELNESKASSRGLVVSGSLASLAIII